MLSLLQKRLLLVGRVFTVSAMLIGIIGLLGWLFGYEALKTYNLSNAFMKGNSAILIIITAFLLFILKSKKYKITWLIISIVFVFASLTLTEHLFQLNFGIDELFFTVKERNNSIAMPGRMTWIAALSFSLLSLSIFFHSLQKISYAQVAATPVVILMYVVILGYCFKISNYYDFGLYSSISVPTSAALFLLGFASIFLNPDKGFMAMFSSSDTSSIMLRFIYGYNFVSLPLQVAFYLFLINQLSFSPKESIVFILIVTSVASFPVAMFLLSKIKKLDKERYSLSNLLEDTNKDLTKANNELQAMVEEYTVNNESLILTTDKLNLANQALTVSNQRFEKLHNELAQMVADRTADLEYTLIELKERNQELDQYVYKVSHDIRSPIASITGVISLIKLEDPPQNIEHYLSMIESRISKLDNFIKSVLSHSKSLNTPIVAEPIDFEGTVNQCWEEFRFENNWNKIRLRFGLQSDSIFKSDQTRLEIVLRNLMSNAIRYQKSTGDNWLIIEVNADKEKAIIKVEDNGEGIKEQHLSKIFQMFYRASTTSEGSGLGLYIVNQVIERMNGDIRIKSKIGEGTLFTITLPNEP